MSAPDATRAVAADAFDRSRARFDGLVGLLGGPQAGALASIVQQGPESVGLQ